MDKADDQKRYFIFGSAVCEVVTPILRQKLRDHYTGLGIADFQAFIDHQPVRHILFHLRYKDKHCCNHRLNCYNHPKPPLAFYQWNQLYTTSTSPICGRSCHCKYTANGVDLDAIDLTLASLLVLKMCGLSQDEEKAVKELRHFKNNHLSHTINGYIEKDEFDNLWKDLVANTLILDPTKEDDMIRILNRPLDARLCEKYRIELMEVHKKLDEIDGKLNHHFGTCTLPELYNGIKNLESLLQGRIDNEGSTARNLSQRQYGLGQDIFCPQYTEIDLKSLPGVQISGKISDILMTDDDRIVVTLWDRMSLLICNSDGASAYTIPLEGEPWGVTTITDSTVAVTFTNRKRVVVYNINTRAKIKTIPILRLCWGITTTNNRLAVGGNRVIWIIDLQTWKVVNTIKTDKVTLRIHASGGKIFSLHYKLPYLTCYNQLGEKLYTTAPLPSPILDLTSLQDGSLYATCYDNQVYHISCDGQNYRLVQTEGINSKGWRISYNHNRQKLLHGEDYCGKITIFHQS